MEHVVVVSTFKQIQKDNNEESSRTLVFDCTSTEVAESLISELLKKSMNIIEEASLGIEDKCKTMIITNNERLTTLTFESPSVISEESWSIVYKAMIYDPKNPAENHKYKYKIGKRDINETARQYAKR